METQGAKIFAHRHIPSPFSKGVKRIFGCVRQLTLSFMSIVLVVSLHTVVGAQV